VWSLPVDAPGHPPLSAQYRLLRATRQARLYARMDRSGAVDIQLRWTGSRRAGRKDPWVWHAGPFRAGPRLLNAYRHAARLLDDDGSLKAALRLARRTSRDLYASLMRYALVLAAHYRPLFRDVRVAEGGDVLFNPSQQPLVGWVAAEVLPLAAVPQRPRSSTSREVLLLVQGHAGWQLWSRVESVHSPLRYQRKLCTTNILREDPALAAEFLVYFALCGSGNSVNCSVTQRGIIAPERLAILHRKIISDECAGRKLKWWGAG